ncbi:MAG: amino acid ABC transporter permease [Cryobacterium sp.]|nr:amino acid ABC transporter permease [Cryobacterium sp.]
MTLTTPIPVDEQPFDIRRRRHLGRWISGTIVLGLLALLAYSAATNPRFEWESIGGYLFAPAILNGVIVTLQLTFISMAIGIALGVILAIMRLSPNPVLSWSSAGFVGFFRGTPLLVQLIFWYNLSALYPVISFGIPGVALNANELITPFLAAILGLSLNQAAYMSEIVRAGIISVDRGQREAATAMGLTGGQTMRKVILPQAMRVIIPPTGNELVGMLKATALVSVIAVADLLYSAQIIYARNFDVIPLLIAVSIWYVVLTTILSIGQEFLERHYSRGTVFATASRSGLVRRMFATGRIARLDEGEQR